MSSSFRPPREEANVDIDAHVARVDPRATVKGLFFQDLIATVRAARPGYPLESRAGIPTRRYLPFLDYPCADWFRLKVAAAEALHPSLLRGPALRSLGRSAFPAFLRSTPGRMMFEIVAPNLVDALALAPRAYSVITTAGRVRHEGRGPRAADLVFDGFPGFIETYQVGIVEGVCEHYGIQARITVALTTLADGTLRVEW